MNNNVVNKKSFLSQVTEMAKTNIRNIIILFSLCFVLFLSFQIYSFYISNKIQKNSIDYLSFNEANNIYENIMNNDFASSAIKERVNKIHEFYSNK